jgi:hypothetical protein
VCSDASIDVTDVSVLCDSPGVWYYGSNGYRNSQKCQKGDKANLQLTFDIIQEDLDKDYIYLTLTVFGGDQEVIVYHNALLCSISALKKTSKVACPQQGSFSVSTKFYFSYAESDDNTGNDRYLGDDDCDDDSYKSSASFKPLVSVGFASSKNRNDYDLGGANTNLCAGKSKNIQSEIAERVHKGASHPIVTFLLSFALLIGVIAALAGLTYSIWKKRLLDNACAVDKVCAMGKVCAPKAAPAYNGFYYSQYDDDVFEDDNRKLELMRKNAAMLSL